MPEAMIRGLEAAGFGVYRWGPPAAEGGEVRLVTAFNSRPEDVEALIAKAAALAGR